MSYDGKTSIGIWRPCHSCHSEIYEELIQAVSRLDRMLYVLGGEDRLRYAIGGAAQFDQTGSNSGEPILAVAPPCLPEFLGDPSFCEDYGLLYPCYAGSMAYGISSERLVMAMGKAGMLGFFGAAGLPLEVLEGAVARLSGNNTGFPFGVNVINRPEDRGWERCLVDILLRYSVPTIEASAYIIPSPALVKYRVTGLKTDTSGNVVACNHVIAKVSRMEVARRFLEPPPPGIVEKLRTAGEITEEEARLAPHISLAQDITVEADSGGHTDHRPALAILPSMLRLAGEIQCKHGYVSPPRVGLAGGIGTPAAAAAAFSMGAAYIVTGSVNQACVESGTSESVRAMLARAAQTDVADAPAADMFEKGVTVQVLKKGSRFAERADRLYQLFRRCERIEEIPLEQKTKIEETIFRGTLEEIWTRTKTFLEKTNPKLLESATTDPKKKMALVFRWYLGNAARWAITGVQDRAEDFQIWCGPAMGAFNEWTKNTFLEDIARRSAPVIALNLLLGAAMLLRLETLRAQNIPIRKDVQLALPVETFPDFMRTRLSETRT